MQNAEYINKIFVSEEQWVQLLRKYVSEACTTGADKDIADHIMTIGSLRNNYDIISICMSLTEDELISFFAKYPDLYPHRIFELVRRVMHSNTGAKQEPVILYTRVLSIDVVHSTIEALAQNRDYKILHLPNYKSINDYLCPRSVHEKFSSRQVADESFYTVFKYDYKGNEYYLLWNKRTKQQQTSYLDLWSLVDYHLKNGIGLYYLIEGWKQLQVNGSTNFLAVEPDEISVRPEPEEATLIGTGAHEGICVRIKNLLDKYGDKLFRYDRFVNEEHELMMRDEMIDLKNESLKNLYYDIDSIFA
jgi:hypothetical protein